MKQLSLLFALLIGITSIISCEKTGLKDSGEENAIRGQAAIYEEAFNNKNADKLSSLWAEDAIYINPVTGESAEGREEIAELFRDRFTEEDQQTIKITIHNISFPNPKTAIVNGVTEFINKDQIIKKIAFKSEYVNENNTWLLETVKEIEISEPASNYDHLKEIAWLEGNWIDEDENVTINSKFSWDKYKNFLTENFAVNVLDQDEIQGQQIIGWDPKEKKIRSWVFDSDGGFGEGKWSIKKNGSIFDVQIVYTLSDGRKASATHIYSKVDDHTYTFASIGRDVDGEVLPNVEPVKVVKVR